MAEADERRDVQLVGLGALARVNLIALGQTRIRSDEGKVFASHTQDGAVAKPDRQAASEVVTDRYNNTVSKACDAMVEKGFAYERSVGAFVDELHALGNDAAYRNDATLPSALNQFTSALRELQSHRTLLLQQAKATVAESLRQYVARDVRGVKDLAKLYHKMSDDLDAARARRAACPPSSSHLSLSLSPQPENCRLTKEGYLFKRAHNVMRTWSRRWFILRGGQLLYVNRDKEEPPQAFVEDLRICTVKAEPSESIDRTNCFEIITPSRNFILQADNGIEKERWILALQTGISDALNNNAQTSVASAQRMTVGFSWPASRVITSRHAHSQTCSCNPTLQPLESGDQARESQRRELQNDIAALPGNELCADCGRAKPSWVAINMGVCLCINCSGVHRSLGTHFSKVRSLGLDHIDAEICKVIGCLGNVRCNSVLEFVSDEVQPLKKQLAEASESDLRELVEQFILNKYIYKKFIDPTLDVDQLQEDLFVAAGEGDVATASACLLGGADINAYNDDGLTPLMLAAELDDTADLEDWIRVGLDAFQQAAMPQLPTVIEDTHAPSVSVSTTTGKLAITDLSQDLDANLGCMVLSDYEQPGRYHKWMKGFRNPPLMLTSREYAFQLTALNDRGQILLPAIRRELEQTQYIDNLTVESDFLQGRVARPDRRFLEEERSRQPSIFTVVRAIANAFHSPADAVLGLYGAFGYDLTFQFEPTKLRMTRPAHQRDIVLYIPDEVVVWDPREDLAFVYSYDFAWDGKSTQGLPRTGPKTVVQYADELERSQDHEPGQYATKVAKAKEKFKRGDLFECVLSQSFYSLLPCPPSELFRRLRKGNPAPFTFIMNLGSNEYLVGGSPEMYVRVQGDEVETCPISGTIRRGRDPVEDAKQILTLLADPKEESELTMCTDVDRNDKSRICEAGSVKVVGRRQIEMYSRLIHTVDHVKGKLREGFDALDAFLCHTWAVTVTGAPKPWAIQFVEDMEESPRGWYAGAVGALHFDGSLNTGLTLRTIQIHNGVASVRAGATLLYDSEPDKEEQETRLKASAFLDVLRVAPEDMSEALSAYQGEQRRAGAGLRVVVIDHQDSFVHTLANYLRQTGAEVMTLRTGFQPAELQALHPDMALLSPGPGCPADFNVSGEIALLMRLCIPTFGVCLGLQGMVEHFGGRLDVLQYPLHGKPTAIDVVEPRSYIFKDLPRRFTVARYHSLYARVEDVPTKNFKVTAVSEDGVVMAIEHRTLPLAAVQFHPESILTDHVHGLSMLQNVLHEFTSRGKAGFQRRKTVI
ncbi:uncharacterized protein MONBRDRAFT_39378 [Monosiga brevicollis MX1]|uniref:p-aminobenzoic acid synthase n=1 Tax=Monosiga brevicollis TaxID=81824 RepID=A9VE95_MONBE|nr:uncharacterized protein MONBRDRAFT_39378 [Monosiga brevicollis MX1]EDQ84146.1 predicted protein [Monosiga brevicollis MX1]|eukprot:XP_001751041.1 hypothetical protein [Monosiga brevicollis MX1]